MARHTKNDVGDTAPPDKAPQEVVMISVSDHGQANYPYNAKGRVVNGSRTPHKERWKHECAAALHDWKLYTHHMGEEKMLSSEDYGKAIEAACKLDSKGHVHPHQPALFVLDIKA